MTRKSRKEKNKSITTMQNNKEEGLELPGVDVSGGVLGNLKLKNANLTDANFSESITDRPNFTGATMTGANLTKALCIKATCKDTDLSKANAKMTDFSGSKFKGANLSGAKIPKANFSDAIIESTDFRSVDARDLSVGRPLRHHRLMMESNPRSKDTQTPTLPYSGDRESNPDCDGANFSKSKLNQVKFDNAVLECSSFQSADIKKSFYHGVRLDEVDFSNAKLSQTSIHTASLNNTKFAGAEFAGAELTEAEYAGAEPVINASYIENVHGKNTSFQGCKFKSCSIGETEFNTGNFDEAQLVSVSMKQVKFLDRSTFKEAVFSNVTLEGVGFSRADMTGIKFKGSTISSGKVDKPKPIPDHERRLCIIMGEKRGMEIIKQGSFDAPSEWSEWFSEESAKYKKKLEEWSTFPYTHLETTFHETVLNKAKFLKTKFDRVHFQGASLKESAFVAVNFDNVTVEGVDFSHAVLREIKFQNSTIGFHRKQKTRPYRTTRGGYRDYKRKLKEWEADRYDYSEASFLGAELVGAQFLDTNFDGVNFNHAQLEGSYFKTATIGSGQFHGANLKGSTFTHVSFSDKADFTGADFTSAMLEGKVEYDDDDASGYDSDGDGFTPLSNCSANFTNANFTNATIKNFDDEGMNCENTNFTGATFINMTFNWDNLNYAQFNHAKFLMQTKDGFFDPSDEKFKSSKDEISMSYFRLEPGKRLHGTQFKHTCFHHDSGFYGCILDGINFEGASLIGVDFSLSNFSPEFERGAVFENANLTDARFDGADLSSANFTGANLRGCDFTGALLTSANLDGADIKGAHFIGQSRFGAARANQSNGGRIEPTDNPVRTDLRGVDLRTVKNIAYAHLGVSLDPKHNDPHVSEMLSPEQVTFIRVEIRKAVVARVRELCRAHTFQKHKEAPLKPILDVIINSGDFPGLSSSSIDAQTWHVCVRVVERSGEKSSPTTFRGGGPSDAHDNAAALDDDQQWEHANASSPPSGINKAGGEEKPASRSERLFKSRTPSKSKGGSHKKNKGPDAGF